MNAIPSTTTRDTAVVLDWLRTLPLAWRARVLSTVTDTRNSVLFSAERVAAVYELTRQPGASYQTVAELLGQSVNTVNKAVTQHRRNLKTAERATTDTAAADAEPRSWTERAAAIRAHVASGNHKAGIGCGGPVCTFGDL